MSTSAYDASVKVFEEHFLNGSHMEAAQTSTAHANYPFRTAYDVMFLSILHSHAKSKGYSRLPDVLSKLQRGIEYIYEDLYNNQYWKNADGTNSGLAYNSPSMGVVLQAAIFVKKFAYNDLTTNLRREKIDWIYDEMKYWLNHTYLTERVKNQTCSEGYLFREIVSGKRSDGSTIPDSVRFCSGTHGTLKSGFSANIVAVHMGALALDSDFFHKPTNPNQKDYQFYDRIVEMGQFLMALSFGDSTGKLQNVGGARPTEEGDDEGSMVSSGYTSWHAMGLAQAAHATVYTSRYADRPNSMFMSEAELIAKGFQIVEQNITQTTSKGTFGIVPKYFVGFDYNIEGQLDASEELYALVWVAKPSNQSIITWLDAHLAEKYKRDGNFVSGEPVIVTAARTDEQSGVGNETNFHRALCGLAAGMLNGVTFN
jgi:hypothetical protein